MYYCVLYCPDVKVRSKCPCADFHSKPLCKFTLRLSRDDWCTQCRNRRPLIVDFLFPIVGPVFCPCFECSVSLYLLDCSTSQTYQNVAKEPFFLTKDENTEKAIRQSACQNSKWTTKWYRLLWDEHNQNQRSSISS